MFLQIFGTGNYAKVEAVTVKSNAHIKKMVSVQKKTKKCKFANPYNQNNNENRTPLKPKSKVVNPPPRQQFVRPPQLVPKAPKQNLKNQNQNCDQNCFNNQRSSQRSAPRYYNNTNAGHQQNHHFQNAWGSVSIYYGDQSYSSYMRQQQQRQQQQFVLQQNMNQGFHNLNTAELMRMRQMIQSELYYLRIQNDANYYQSRRSVSFHFS